jgi:hypothetical protein
LTRVSVRPARWVMRQRQSAPSPPSGCIGELREVFEHPYFANDETRRTVMLASVQSKFDGENRYPWDHYFEIPIGEYLR